MDWAAPCAVLVAMVTDSISSAKRLKKRRSSGGIRAVRDFCFTVTPCFLFMAPPTRNLKEEPGGGEEELHVWWRALTSWSRFCYSVRSANGRRCPSLPAEDAPPDSDKMTLWLVSERRLNYWWGVISDHRALKMDGSPEISKLSVNNLAESQLEAEMFLLMSARRTIAWSRSWFIFLWSC